MMKINDRFKSDYKAYLNLAVAYKEKNQHSDAKQCFEKAIELGGDNSEPHFYYGAYILEKIMRNRAFRFGLSSKDLELLQKAEALFSKSIILLKDTENKTEIVDAYINRSTIRSIFDKFDHALADINIAIQINSENPNVYANRARIHVLNKEQDKAIEDFKTSIGKGINKDDVFPILISCYLERPDQKIDDAIGVIQHYYGDEKKIIQNIIPATLLIECLIAKKDYPKAKEILSILYKRFGRDPRILLAEADIRKSEGDLDGFNSLAAEASSSAKDFHKGIATLELARGYKNTGDYDKAAPLYESFVTLDLYDEVLRDYLICLYKSKEHRGQNIKRCLDICQSFRKKGKQIQFLLELEASIYRELDKLLKASALYLELSKIDPKNYKHKLNYAALLIDIGAEKEKEGRRLLIEIKDQVIDQEYLIMLAKYLTRIHEYDDAIKQAYKALEMESSNAETQLLYIYIMLNRGNTKSPILDSDRVKEDFLVKVKQNGHEREFLISSNPNAALTKSEIYKESGYGKALYGKKVGDKIEIITDSELKESIQIIEIKSKYVKALQDIMADFNKNFPDSKAIKKVKADPETLTTLAKRRSKNATIVSQMYLSKKLTIGALSSFININLFIAWSGLISKGMQLYCAYGRSKEQKTEQDLIDTSREVLIDPISLFTLAYLNKLDLPLRFFNKIYISRSTLDELDLEVSEESGIKEEGYSTISFEDNKSYLYKISPETIKQRREFIAKIRNFVSKNYSVLGLDKPIDSELQEKERILGRAYIYIIQTALECNLNIFSDDLMFRTLAANDYSLKGFSIQNFLIKSSEKSLINKEEYFDAIIELAKLNYHYLSVSADLLFHSIEKVHFQVAHFDNFEALMKSLESKETSSESLIAVLSDFMRLIYVESLPDTVRRNLLFRSLQALSRNRDINRNVKTFTIVLNKKLGFANYIMPKIKKDIIQWLKTNVTII